MDGLGDITWAGAAFIPKFVQSLVEIIENL